MRPCLKLRWDFDEEVLLFSQQLGLKGILMGSPRYLGDSYLEYEKLQRAVDCAATYGLRTEAVENVPIFQLYKVMFGIEGRDEQLENYRKTIRNVAKAGIPILGHNFMPSMVWRTSDETPGRGGALVSSFDQALEAEGNRHLNAKALSPKLIPDPEELWSNYEYFMKAVLPVAEECGVRLALHPDDPPVASVGGMARIFTSPEAFRRAAEMTSSDAWGIDLCLGCCSEMPDGVAKVFEMIETFAPAGKILYVHFRDVQGHVPAFRECFLDEGNFDPAEVMLALRRSGFAGVIIDDHVPHMVHDEGYGFRARGHAIGYIQGLLRMMEIKS